MIPKVIHYCWFGGNPLPKSAQKCIASWRKYLPDYEIKEWNESNFDVNIIPYTAEAYKAKKYAFVSDYARFWILYKYGGLYFDTDVEVIKNMDDIIDKGPFMAFEDVSDGIYPIAPGLVMGASPKMDFLEHIIGIYNQKSFEFGRGMDNIVTLTTDIFIKKGLLQNNKLQKVYDYIIYPVDYFCPLCKSTGKMTITENTCGIHWYDGTWLSPKQKLAMWIKMHLGEKTFKTLCGIKRILKKNK